MKELKAICLYRSDTDFDQLMLEGHNIVARLNFAYEEWKEDGFVANAILTVFDKKDGIYSFIEYDTENKINNKKLKIITRPNLLTLLFDENHYLVYIPEQKLKVITHWAENEIK